MAKLEEDYGVSDEDQRKKIYGSLKDVMKKDSYTVRPNPNPDPNPNPNPNPKPRTRCARPRTRARPPAPPLPAHQCARSLGCAGQHELLLADAHVGPALRGNTRPNPNLHPNPNPSPNPTPSSNHNPSLSTNPTPNQAIYLWLSLKYEKQIARYMKRYL